MKLVEFAGLSNRPNPGSKTELYLDTETGVIFRWTGAAFAAIALAPSTDSLGNTVLVGADGVEILVFNSAYASGVFSSTNMATPYTPQILDINATLTKIDTHGLVDPVNNVIANPFYGVSDCKLKARGTIQWAATPAPGAADYKAIKLYSGVSIAGLATISAVAHPSFASVVYGQQTAFDFTEPLSSAIQFIAFYGDQASAGALSGAGTWDVEFFA